jgi:hypothetical protein
LGINIDPIRLALLPVACWAIVPPQLPAMCFGRFFSYRDCSISHVFANTAL